MAGRPPWLWIVIGVIGYPLVASSVGLAIAAGLGVATDWEIVVAHLAFWVVWTTPLAIVFGLAVWGLRAYGYRRLASVLRLLLVVPSVWMIGASWRAVTDAYTLGLWAYGLLPPLTLAALLPVLPRLHATNPFFALGWYWLPRLGRDDVVRKSQPGEGCASQEAPGSRDASATPSWTTAAVIGSALCVVTAAALLQRFGRPKSSPS